MSQVLYITSKVRERPLTKSELYVKVEAFGFFAR